MTNPTTDLAARFEAKREEALKGAQDRGEIDSMYFYWETRAAAFAEAMDMARAGAAGGAGVESGCAGLLSDLEDAVAVLRSNNAPACAEAVERATRLIAGSPAAPPTPAQQGSSFPPLTADRVDVGGLERLNSKATSGEWSAEEAGRITAAGTSPGYDIPVWGTILTARDTKDIEDGVTHWSTDGERQANARFVAALVNAYRSGHLVPASLPGGTGSAEEGTGEPSGTGSREPSPSVSASGFDPSRAALRALRIGDMVRVSLNPDKPWTTDWQDGAYEVIGLEIDRHGEPNVTLSLNGDVGSDGFRPNDLEPAVQGTEAEGRNTEGGSVHEGPVGEAEAPTPDPVGEAKALLEGPYRTGRKVPRNVYHCDEPLFMAATDGEARILVARLNAGLATIHASQDQAGEVRS